MNTLKLFPLKYILFILCISLSSYQLVIFTSLEGKEGMLLLTSLLCSYTSGVLLFLPTKKWLSCILILYVLIQVYATITL
jgi:hypothetical protein